MAIQCEQGIHAWSDPPLDYRCAKCGYLDADIGFHTMKTAIESGDHHLLDMHLSSDIDFNETPSRKTSFLNSVIAIAVQHQHIECVSFLIQHGADVNSMSFCMDFSLVGHASKLGNIEMTNMLLGAGANVNGGNHNDSQAQYDISIGEYRDDDSCITSQAGYALMAALYDCNTDIVRILLMAGAAVNIRNAYGMTPLHFAVKGDTELVKMLIDQGANVNARNREGDSVLHYAVLHDTETVSSLIVQGADVSAVNNEGISVLHSAMEYGYEQVVLDILKAYSEFAHDSENKSFFLHQAIKRGFTKVADVLKSANGIQYDVTDEGNTLLHTAAMYSGHDQISELIHAGIDVNSRNIDGETPIFYALYGRNHLNILTLIDHRADICIFDGSGRSTIFIAATMNSVDTLRVLVNSSVDKAWVSSEMTKAFIGSVRWGAMDAMSYLKEQGVDINVRDPFNLVPLHIALQEGQHKVTMQLIRWGAKVERKDSKLRTPLYYAIEKRDQIAAIALIRAGAKPFHVDTDGWQPLALCVKYSQIKILKILAKRVVGLNGVDIHGNTLLHTAIDCGQLRSVQELIRMGADISIVNRRGETPLMYAVQKHCNAIVATLLKAGASRHIRDHNGLSPFEVAIRQGRHDIVDLFVKAECKMFHVNRQYKYTLLHDAAKHGETEPSRVLISYKVNVNAQDTHGMTPLHYAAKVGRIELIKLLVDSNADINALSKDHISAFGYSVEKRRYATACLLLESGASVEVYGQKRSNLLHIAAANGHAKIMDILVEKGISINARDNKGRTPLYRAVVYGADKPNGAEYLLDKLIQLGADPNIANNRGLTPLHKAAKLGDETAIDILLQHSARADIYDSKKRTAMDIAIEFGHQGIIEQMVAYGITIPNSGSEEQPRDDLKI